jgi:hypothetical protein
MYADAPGQSEDSIRQVTDRTSRGAPGAYRFGLRRRVDFAAADAGIEAMRTAMDIHLGDAAPAERKLFSSGRSQFQSWRVMAVSWVAPEGAALRSEASRCFERSQCRCPG